MMYKIIRTFTPEQHLDMMNQSIKEIKQICTNEDWELISHEVKDYNYKGLEALRIFLLGGISPKESIELVDFAIDLSELTTLDSKEAAIEIIKILNKFNNGLR